MPLRSSEGNEALDKMAGLMLAFLSSAFLFFKGVIFMRETRDSINFENMKISSLFAKLFVPTLMGLIFSASLNIADGIFVGRGCGSDALAAVNIAAPIFMTAMGLSLLFGTGVSIVCAIHLSRRNFKAANINVTQAFLAGTLLMLALCLTIFSFPIELCYLFGGSKELEALVCEYLVYVSPMPVFLCSAVIGMFVIRLDGSPEYAMYANIIPALINIFLDWLFVFPLQLGLKGAASATVIAEFIAFLMIAVYMFKLNKTLRLYRLKLSSTSFRLTIRNLSYMAKLGLSTFIGEAALACMMVAGNYAFMKHLKEDGVAAYSVACYLFPMIFMFANAISQSALPIISYNFGRKAFDRVRHTFTLSIRLSLLSGLLLSILSVIFTENLIGIFIAEESAAYAIGVEGFPYFALGFVFFSLNIVCIGYYQSLEKAGRAIFLMLLRGVIFIVPIFAVLPDLTGTSGLWLAVPISEILTFMVIAFYLLKNK